MIYRTIRERKLRVNHERALHFTAANLNYVSVIPDVRYNFGSNDFWISYFVQTSVNSIHFQLFDSPCNLFVTTGNASITLSVTTAESSLQQVIFATTNWPSNKNNFWHILIRRVGGEFTIFVNGKNAGSVTFQSTDTLDFSGMTFFPIGTRLTLANSFVNGFINNFVVSMGTITSDQVRLIHALGGTIPGTQHINIINHWPLTQKSYYKDGSDIKAWDVVEQYNHAKVTPLVPIHGVLKNFTDAEVGADGTANPASVIDVYIKSSYVHSGYDIIENGLKFDSSLGARRLQIATPLIATDTQEFTLIHAFRIDALQTGNRYFFIANDGGIASTNNYIAVLRSESLNQLRFLVRRANDIQSIDISNSSIDELLQGNGISILALRVKNGTAEAYINGILIGSDLGALCPDISAFTTIRINAYTSTGNEASATYFHTALYSRYLSKKEILKICDNTFINPLDDDSLELMPDYQNPFDSGGGMLKLNDLSANAHNIVIQNFTDLTDVQNNLIDINTLR